MQIFLFLSIFSSIILWSTYGILLLFTRVFVSLLPYANYIFAFGLLSSLSFIIGIIVLNTENLLPFVYLYRYGAFWLGFLSTLFVVTFLALFIALICKFSYTSWWSVSILLLFLIFLNGYGIYKSFNPKVTDYTISLPWTHQMHGKNIVLIADTHYGNIYSEQDAQKLVKKINQLHPEVVLIPWDFFDGPTIDYQKVAEEFRGITATWGVLFSNGNHEEYHRTDEMLTALEKANIRILNNQSFVLNGVTFLGVTYHANETKSWLKNTLNSLHLEKDLPIILLKHKPTLQDTLKKYPISLVVSGHTHFWQMFPFNLVTLLIYGKYAYWLHSDKGLQSLTTSGVGTWWPPQRIGTSGEIVNIHIQ